MGRRNKRQLSAGRRTNPKCRDDLKLSTSIDAFSTAHLGGLVNSKTFSIRELVVVAFLAFNLTSASKPHRAGNTFVSRAPSLKILHPVIGQIHRNREFRVRTAIRDEDQSMSHALENTTAGESRRVPMQVRSSIAPVVLSPARRSAIIAVALAGAAETVWLTLEKLGVLSDASFCSSEGCSQALGGPYGSVAGIPLTLPGALAYLSVVALALAPRLDLDERAETFAQQALVATVTSMAVFSAYLMALLAFVIKAPCPYCITSATLSETLAVLIWWGGKPLPSPRDNLVTGASAAAVSSLAAFALVLQAGGPLVGEPSYKLIQEQQVNAALSGKRAPPVLTESSPRALSLAKYLKSIDTKLYTAYWCSHCYDQKQRLGKEAISILGYVECAQDAENNNRALCVAKEIKSYPTWEINGKFYSGEKSLETLEELSNAPLDIK